MNDNIEYWQSIARSAFDRILEQKNDIEAQKKIIRNLYENIDELNRTVEFLQKLLNDKKNGMNDAFL